MAAALTPTNPATPPAAVCCAQGRGCSPVVKVLLIAGLAFVALGITFAFLNMPSAATDALISVGTPLLSFALMAGIWQIHAQNSDRKWLITFLAAAAIFAAGVAIASTLSGAPALVGSVAIGVGSSVMIASIMGYAWSRLQREIEAREPPPPPQQPEAPALPTTGGRAVGGDTGGVTHERRRLTRLQEFEAKTFEEQSKFFVGHRNWGRVTSTNYPLLGLNEIGFGPGQRDQWFGKSENELLATHLPSQFSANTPVVKGVVRNTDFIAWKVNDEIYVLRKSVTGLGQSVNKLHELVEGADGTYAVQPVSFNDFERIKIGRTERRERRPAPAAAAAPQAAAAAVEETFHQKFARKNFTEKCRIVCLRWATDEHIARLSLRGATIDANKSPEQLLTENLAAEFRRTDKPIIQGHVKTFDFLAWKKEGQIYVLRTTGPGTIRDFKLERLVGDVLEETEMTREMRLKNPTENKFPSKPFEDKQRICIEQATEADKFRLDLADANMSSEQLLIEHLPDILPVKRVVEGEVNALKFIAWEQDGQFYILRQTGDNPVSDYKLEKLADGTLETTPMLREMPFQPGAATPTLAQVKRFCHVDLSEDEMRTKVTLCPLSGPTLSAQEQGLPAETLLSTTLPPLFNRQRTKPLIQGLVKTMEYLAWKNAETIYVLRQTGPAETDYKLEKVVENGLEEVALTRDVQFRGRN